MIGPYQPIFLISALLLGLVLDWVFGDPPALWRRIPHPVALIGRGLDRLAAYRLSGVTSMIDIIQGAVALALMLGLVLAIVLGLVWLLREALMVALGDDRSWMFAWVWLLVEALLIWPWLAWHSLFYHVRAVADGLDQAGSEQASLEQADLEQANLEQARLKDGQAALAHIVGRDVTRLDKEGVARAACESLAENYSDGVLAPIFWYLVGGLPGLVLYKAVNTADSMWGYRSQSWLYFGRIAARLDDVMNIIPARLTAVLLMITGDIRAFTHHLRATWHHAPRHASVNAGWPEAALASLHDLRLGGPRDYPGQGHTDCWIGAGRGELDAGDIRKACQLFCMMHRCLLAAFALTVAIMSAYMTFYSVYYP